MKQRPRIYYTESQKKLMWDHWQKGDPLQHISSFNTLRVKQSREQEKIAVVEIGF